MMNIDLGNLFIIAAPSGGGKTSLVKKLIQQLDGIEVSISHTTRPPRPLEQNGVDYFFVNDASFLDMINKNAFIEHAIVFGYHYGTSVEQINVRLKAGIDVVLDIDWQGAQQIRQIFPAAVSIFIMPPSLQILKDRLLKRGQDNDETIKQRMQLAQDEMSHFAEFDYLIVNDDFTRASEDLCAIVIANRLRLARQKNKLTKLLSFILASK